MLTSITATEILYGKTHATELLSSPRQDRELPVHPALAVLDWDDEPATRVHALAIGVNPNLGIYWACDCGHFEMSAANAFEVTAAAISHALHTCASCGGPKPSATVDGQMDVFPRCSGCAL